MLALLILPVLISGALFYSSKLNIKYYYQLNRLDGQLLYLKVASSGLWLMFFSLIGALCVKLLFPSLQIVTNISDNFAIFDEPLENRIAIWLLLLSLTTMTMAVTLPFLIYIKEFIQVKLMIKLLKNGGIPDAAIKKGRRVSIIMSTLPKSSLKSFLLDAGSKNKVVMVTLENKKVYVGFIEELSDPNEKRSYAEHVTMRIIYSGYRCDDKLAVHFTNNYKMANAENTLVIFKRDDITIASFFDTNTFNNVNDNLG